MPVLILQSQEGQNFELPYEVAIECSEVIRQHADTCSEEDEEAVIPFPVLTASQLEFVQAVMLNYAKEGEMGMTEYVRNHVNQSHPLFFQAVEAANFLQFTLLAEILAKIAVEHIRGRRPEQLCEEWDIPVSALDQDTYDLFMDHVPWSLHDRT